MNSLLFTQRCLRFFTPVGGLLLFIQCSNFSKEPGPSSSAGGSFSSGGGSSVSAGGGDGGSGGGRANAGGVDGSSGGSGGPCLTIWEGCPPMDTALEPLHERQNGAGSLLLAHGAFWLQGAVAFMTSEGTAGEIFLGALRIPYEPGSTPRVLEGNVADGMFVEHKGLVYHADASLGRHLAVYEPNGDLHQLVDVTGGDSDIFMLTGLSVVDGMAVVTSPSCTHVFFIDTQSWEVRYLNTAAQYAGGTTRTLFNEDSVYCMGNAHIFKIDPATATVQDFWTDPDLANGIQSESSYSHLANTSQGLMTWITSPRAGVAPLRILDPDTLALSDYDDPGVTILAGYYVPIEDAYYISDAGLHRYQVATKELERVLPEQRPWGGRWDFETILQMDDDYYYWVEGWVSESGQQSEFIVRYPRNP